MPFFTYERMTLVPWMWVAGTWRPDKNCSIILPFANTYENAFESMCEVNSYTHHAKGERLIIFPNGTEGDAEPPPEAVGWVEKVGQPVAMKDFLAISFALDYDRHGGDQADQRRR